jgi:hypothetical protein
MKRSIIKCVKFNAIFIHLSIKIYVYLRVYILVSILYINVYIRQINMQLVEIS